MQRKFSSPRRVRAGEQESSREEHLATCPPSTEVFMHACSAVSDFATPWTIAHQAPLSMGFSRQEYCSGLPFPPPGNLPDRPRDRTLVFCVSCIGRQILYHCTRWEVPPENPPKPALMICSSMNSGTGPYFFPLTGQSQVLLTLPRPTPFGNLKQSHEVSSQNFETYAV